MSGSPPPIKSEGYPQPPPLKLSGPAQLTIRAGSGGSVQLTIGATRGSSPDTSRAIQELTSKVQAVVSRGLQIIAFHSPCASPIASLTSLTPIHIPSLTPSETKDLAYGSNIPAKVQLLAQRTLRAHSDSSSENLSDSPEGSCKSPDSVKTTSLQETITDDEGKMYEVTIKTTSTPIRIQSRDGSERSGPMITTSSLSIAQLTHILPNTNPHMNSPVMEKFITKNIGSSHLQQAKDLFSSVINELEKSPSSQPVSIDLECNRKQFRLIFDKSKNEVLLFNREKFTEGTEKTVHDAVAIPISIPGSARTRIEVESRAVLYSKPDMKSLLERGIGQAEKLQAAAGEDPRKGYIIPPPKSQYLTNDGMLMISAEKLSGDLLDEVNKNDRTIETFQTYLLQGLLGISLIHELGFVHCDAKIENLFLSENTCQVGDLSTCRKKDASFPPYARAEDPENSRSTDKRSYDIFSLGKSLGTTIEALKAKKQTKESTAFIERLQALIPDMTNENPAERPTIDEVIAQLRG